MSAARSPCASAALVSIPPSGLKSRRARSAVSARGGAIGLSIPALIIANRARSSSIARPDSSDFLSGVAGAVLGFEACLHPAGRPSVARTLEYLLYAS